MSLLVYRRVLGWLVQLSTMLGGKVLSRWQAAFRSPPCPLSRLRYLATKARQGKAERGSPGAAAAAAIASGGPRSGGNASYTSPDKQQRGTGSPRSRYASRHTEFGTITVQRYDREGHFCRAVDGHASNSAVTRPASPAMLSARVLTSKRRRICSCIQGGGSRGRRASRFHWTSLIV